MSEMIRRVAKHPLLSLLEAPPKEDTWPLPVDDFLARNYLRHADVLMTTRKGNLLSWLIRRATKGNFSHAAMVFITPNLTYGWQSTYVIESVFSGVEVTDLRDYFRYRGIKVAIQRLKHEWFTDEIAKRVRGRMLGDIKAKYNFPLMIAMAEGLWFSVESMLQGHKRTIIRRSQPGRRAAPNEFICSGFVQRGYVLGLAEFIRNGTLPAETLRHVIFDRNLASLLPEDWGAHSPEEQIKIVDQFIEQFSEELLAATPRDIEVTPELEWVYVMTDGVVHPVSSYREVVDLMGLRGFPG